MIASRPMWVRVAAGLAWGVVFSILWSCLFTLAYGVIHAGLELVMGHAVRPRMSVGMLVLVYVAGNVIGWGAVLVAAGSGRLPGTGPTRETAPGRCPRCGYDIGGLDAQRDDFRCPECGHAVGTRPPA